MKIIYDFGANNGDDIPYYLKKSDRVVAVEANPHLADQIKWRFHADVTSGRLVVLGCVLSASADDHPVPFYLHKHESVRSQYPTPPADEAHLFDTITLASRRASDIIQQYGEPYYVKIDVEGYDHVVLKELFLAGITPEFISAESHHIDVFSTLVSIGGYKAFKLVDGAGVPVRYHNAVIKTQLGEELYSFPSHSAGPFGEDIAGPWIAPDHFFKLLALVGLGWKDVHARREPAPDPSYAPLIRAHISCDY